jgi:NAD(P)-dependent dehydrogenase (short-subunit alcohol dehydrogenase family)
LEDFLRSAQHPPPSEDGIRAFALHPGSIVTDLAKHLTDEDRQRFGTASDAADGHVPPGRSAAEGGVFYTNEQGAATAVRCATSSQFDGKGAIYCEDVDISPMSDTTDPTARSVRPWAMDPEAAERLSRLSETLTRARIGG